MVGVKKIVPSASQLGVAAPAPWVSQIVSGAPPVTSTFFIFPVLKKPNHWPSGEKNGVVPPSVPGIGAPSKLSISRT
jgi:hypothetical protein